MDFEAPNYDRLQIHEQTGETERREEPKPFDIPEDLIQQQTSLETFEVTGDIEVDARNLAKVANWKGWEEVFTLGMDLRYNLQRRFEWNARTISESPNSHELPEIKFLRSTILPLQNDLIQAILEKSS